jgi:uncharacterized protein (DUF779 family)
MSVTATRAAVDAVRRLSADHGPLAFFQSGGCCDGSSPICVERGELPPSPNDLLLGIVGDAPFYIDAEQYERWGRPDFELDLAGGAPEGFSLGLPDLHFVARSAGSSCPRWTSPAG